jgi:hypothetical protein
MFIVVEGPVTLHLWSNIDRSLYRPKMMVIGAWSGVIRRYRWAFGIHSALGVIVLRSSAAALVGGEILNCSKFVADKTVGMRSLYDRYAFGSRSAVSRLDICPDSALGRYRKPDADQEPTIYRPYTD